MAFTTLTYRINNPTTGVCREVQAVVPIDCNGVMSAPVSWIDGTAVSAAAPVPPAASVLEQGECCCGVQNVATVTGDTGTASLAAGDTLRFDGSCGVAATVTESGTTVTVGLTVPGILTRAAAGWTEACDQLPVCRSDGGIGLPPEKGSTVNGVGACFPGGVAINIGMIAGFTTPVMTLTNPYCEPANLVLEWGFTKLDVNAAGIRLGSNLYSGAGTLLAAGSETVTSEATVASWNLGNGESRLFAGGLPGGWTSTYQTRLSGVSGSGTVTGCTQIHGLVVSA